MRKHHGHGTVTHWPTSTNENFACLGKHTQKHTRRANQREEKKERVWKRERRREKQELLIYVREVFLKQSSSRLCEANWLFNYSSEARQTQCCVKSTYRFRPGRWDTLTYSNSQTEWMIRKTDKALTADSIYRATREQLLRMAIRQVKRTQECMKPDYRGKRTCCFEVTVSDRWLAPVEVNQWEVPAAESTRRGAACYWV